MIFRSKNRKEEMAQKEELLSPGKKALLKMKESKSKKAKGKAKGKGKGKK